MEPPTKRLRIMQSVEVNETNPDYIRDRKIAQEQLKNKWELLFAKYEGMHESMTDEIDMRAGTVVVDRGHCRRLERQLKTMRPRLLDEVVGDSKGETDEDTDEESTEEEDELASAQHTGQYNQVRHGTSSEGRAKDTPRRLRLQSPPPTADQSLQQRSDKVPDITTQRSDQVTDTPSVPSNLLDFVQFPETPHGQQAQNAFIASLTQTINQAVQQAVTPILSTLLTHTPNAQTPRVDNTAKAPSDPKWHFPQLPETPLARSLVRSIQKPSIEPSIRGGSSLGIDTESLIQHKGLERLPSFSGGAHTQAQSYSFVPLRRNSSSEPDGEDIPFTHGKKYHFTLEDDIYLSEQKFIHGRTFKDIRSNTPKWRNWPIHALMSHWNRHVKKKNLLAQIVTQTNSGGVKRPVHEDDQQSNNTVAEVSESSAQSHFPTPSSLERGDQHQQTDEAVYDDLNDLITSDGHYDNDELDLLSLTGREQDGADEHLVPSVESHKHRRRSKALKKIQQPDPKLRNRQVVPDSEDSSNPLEMGMDVDSVLGPDSDDERLDPDYVCDLCHTSFGSQGSLNRHQQQKLCPMLRQVRAETGSESNSDVQQSLRVVFCKLCNAVFNCTSNLKRHHEKNLCSMRNQSSHGSRRFSSAPNTLRAVAITQTGTPQKVTQIPTPQRARAFNPTASTPTTLRREAPNASTRNAETAVAELVTSIDTSADDETQTPYMSGNESIKEEVVEDTPYIPSSASSNSVIDDELPAPRSPSSESDFPTPPPPKSSFSSNPFQTPRARPRATPLPSSGGKSASSVGRKSFLQQVKQSWAKKRGGSSPAPKSVTKRRSLLVVSSKRKRVDEEEDSTDELAM